MAPGVEFIISVTSCKIVNPSKDEVPETVSVSDKDKLVVGVIPDVPEDPDVPEPVNSTIVSVGPSASPNKKVPEIPLTVLIL